MRKYYLAVDIGASSGRHILGHIEDGRMVLEEIYRFDNSPEERDGHLCWNLEKLFAEVLAGLKECRKIGKLPVSVGIDTWAVDFVLLDGQNRPLGLTAAYRDHRTEGMDAEITSMISESDLYARTGIQKQIFNTIYQLCAVKLQDPASLQSARSFLMIPDYFNFLLTGVKKQEYTNATSTCLVGALEKTWDRELIGLLGFPQHLFGELSMPKTFVGRCKPEIAAEIGFDCDIMLPATHDTGSAFLAVPARDDNAIYISSGTWSLMGTENPAPVINEESRLANFTNEGGYDYSFRYLKNIMGLWIIQSIRRELGKKYSFDELCTMAKESADFPSRIDVNHGSFLSPAGMIDAIKEYCRSTGQMVPDSIGELMQCVYVSLAASYAETMKQLEKLSGKACSVIHIVGGGSKDEYLNHLTAELTGKTVLAGPTEGTALGNLMVQMIRSGEYADIAAARAAIPLSFEINAYLPV